MAVGRCHASVYVEPTQLKVLCPLDTAHGCQADAVRLGCSVCRCVVRFTLQDAPRIAQFIHSNNSSSNNTSHRFQAICHQDGDVGSHSVWGSRCVTAGSHSWLPHLAILFDDRRLCSTVGQGEMATRLTAGQSAVVSIGQRKARGISQHQQQHCAAGTAPAYHTWTTVWVHLWHSGRQRYM